MFILKPFKMFKKPSLSLMVLFTFNWSHDNVAVNDANCAEVLVDALIYYK
jgi:hypothetical protein